MNPLEIWGYKGISQAWAFGLGQQRITGGGRVMETQGCLGEGRVGLAPLVCHHLSFPSPILLLCPFYRGKLRRKGLYCKDVDPGRR